MEERQLLNIVYFSNRVEWAYQIRGKMKEDQKKIFCKTELPDIERTISRKISTIEILIENINMEMKEINKILSEKQEEVNNCLKEQKAFHFRDNLHHIYRIIAYFEATLIQMVAVIDLLIKYISTYYIKILKNRKGQKDILGMLRRDGINIEWKRELYFLRRIVTHYYTAWLSLKKERNYFQLIINFPSSIRRLKDYKFFKYDTLSINEINKIFRNFDGFCNNVINWFINTL